MSIEWQRVENRPDGWRALFGEGNAVTIAWNELAPDWAQWFTTDSRGACWWEQRPVYSKRPFDDGEWFHERNERKAGRCLSINGRRYKRRLIARPQEVTA